MNETIDKLKSKIAVLEAENERLSERAEETLLIRLVAQSINSIEDTQVLLENALERISILKNIPYCACAELVDNTTKIIASYASFSNEDTAECKFANGATIIKKLEDGSAIFSIDEMAVQKVNITFKKSDFIPRVALLVPFSIKTIPVGFFLFVDDERSVDEFSSIKMLLDQITEILVERIDKIRMTSELFVLNHELDKIIKDRTRLLTKSQEIAHLGSWEYNSSSDKLVWSDEIYRILGFKPQQFQPTRDLFLERVYEKDLEKVISNYSSFINGIINSYDITYRIVSSCNNKIKIVNERCSCKKDDDGKIVQYYGMLHDISKQKKIEEELQELQNYLSNIIDSMPSILIGVNEDGLVTQWNKTAQQETGISMVEAVGKSLITVFPDLKNEMDMIESGKESKSNILIPKRERLISGKKQYEDVTIYPLISNGIKGAVVRIDNVTRQYELEQQLAQSQKMDAIGQLAGGVAHDFNNMLAGIVGSAEILEDFLNEEPFAKDILSVIINASERAAGLTEKLLAFARQQTTKVMAISVHTIIDDAIAILKQTIDKRIVIEVNLNAEIDVVVADSAQLQSVFINLGINASHAMPNGGTLNFSSNNIDMSIEQCKASSFDLEPGKYLKIEVSDTGTGISNENLSRIFEPFFTTKEQGKGTGLGLAATHGTISKHGGSISVSSEVNIGTVFSIQLPICKDMILDLSSDNEVEHSGGTILLVDDEDVVLKVGETVLSRLGFDVITAENGRSAVEIFNENENIIDLVILDMIMPEMNGRDCFYALRKIKKELPIIIASGFSHEDYIEELNNAGLNAFIQKPFRRYELSKVIAEVLK